MNKHLYTKELVLPTTIELEQELARQKYKFRYQKLLKSTIYILLIVISLSVLFTTFLFSVLHICGESMIPTLDNGDIVISVKKSKFDSGDVVAFYYNNRVLIKRVVATSSQWVDIDMEGNVFINDQLIDEPYAIEKTHGESDIQYPYQVPEGKYFVLGDKRDTSVDSRNSLIGCISKEEIIGKVIFKLWPLQRIGTV